MKYLRLFIAVALSAIICLLFEFSPAAVLIYLALTALVGEYIFPFLIHLSDEIFDLNQRWSEASSGLNVPEESDMLSRFPKSVKVFVMDDDSPIMTWVGWRTLIIGRGCYNLDHAQFLCAMQESAEQRLNLRSLVFLFATVGNLFYLGMRLFCRFGYLVSWILAIPLALVFSIFTDGGFREGIRAGQAAAKVANAIYNAISWVFLRISNLAVYVPYWPLLIWGDRDVDRTMKAKGFEMPLRSLIEAMHQTSYNSPFMRERPLILRMPRSMRLNWLDEQASGIEHYNGGLQRIQIQRVQQMESSNRPQIAHRQRPRRSTDTRRIRLVEQEQSASPPAGRCNETRRIRIVDKNDYVGQ